jgi:3,4-dihydroxy 2-butanone 4-phosphate synthase/GTP cyclohydrolase II
MPFRPIPEILDELKAGRMIILVDDANRENEGDLVIAAEKVTPDAINFMIRHGRGLVCLALSGEKVDALRLAPMTGLNESRYGTAFTVSIEARTGVTTGISAHDRARTILAAVKSDARPEDLVSPGHVFPLRAREGGVLVRAGQTEGAVDLTRLAGLAPAGVICEIMNEDGTMARIPDLISFCAAHGLKMLTVASLIRYRLQHERYIQRVAESILPTRYGDFRMIAYESEMDGSESHVALVYGSQIDSQSNPSASGDPVLVRVHTHCLTGEVFGATLCDCRALLDNSLRLIAEAGQGALIYLHNASRGFSIDRSGLASSGEIAPNRLVLHREPHRDPRSSELSQERMQRARRTLRQIGLGSQILSDLGIQRIRLLTNTPTHIPALQGFGIEIVEQVRIPLDASAAVPTAP